MTTVFAPLSALVSLTRVGTEMQQAALSLTTLEWRGGACARGTKAESKSYMVYLLNGFRKPILSTLLKHLILVSEWG